MKIREVIATLETLAPCFLQESYDNSGLLMGSAEWECTGILLCLDSTEAVVQEAIEKNCNLVIAHHPIIFAGIKKLSGNSYVEKSIITALKNDIAIFAIHTNLDNVIAGVNGRMADLLGLTNRKILQPKNKQLKKLSVFVPAAHAENVRSAIFAAGAGNVGNYSECSFNSAGEGTFKPGEGADPFTGNIGERHIEPEVKVEVIFQPWHQSAVLHAMHQSHPYEEVAYDIILLDNELDSIGSGLVGELENAIPESDFLHFLKKSFDLHVIKHTVLTGKMVRKIAICGGSGSFLIKSAIASGADFYITGDIKYHEYFDAEGKLVIADIGHYESEQNTIGLLFDTLKQKYTTFAVLKTEINTNPVNYFF
jgi:dinuclear metal center YbgI/SA1388 family protein